MKKLTILFIVLFLATISLYADSKEIVVQSARTVIDVLEENFTIKCITPQLLDISRNGHLLPEETQEQLKSLGFDFSGNLVLKLRPDFEHNYDTEHFRIHYSFLPPNAVDSTDSDGDSIPDYINTMANVFEEVFNHMIDELGYTPPPSDELHGGSDAYDIYVISTNAYGLTYWDSFVGDNEKSTAVKEINAYTSYLAMRNNYVGFSNTELENIQVTAAHEFFHAIQFGYDSDEAVWLMEATSTFMEEENYNDVNDCYQYMIPWFEKPHVGLKNITGFIPYGSYILFKYIDEHLGGSNAIRNVWEQSRLFDSKVDDYSIQSIDLALNQHNYSFKLALNNMAIANCILSSDASAGQYSYEEATDYRNYLEYSYFDTVAIQLGIHDSLDFYKGMFENIESYNLREYGSQYIKIKTDTPVKISLKKPANDDDPLRDLKLHTIRKTISGNYEIQSDHVQNIDPGSNTEWIYAVIVSDGNEGSDYNYSLNFIDGVANTNLDFSIINQYPNPFNSSITTKLKIITPQSIDIQIYDILGRKVHTLHSGYLTDGSHDFIWNGTSSDGEKVSSGVYYISAKGTNRQEWKKITLLK